MGASRDSMDSGVIFVILLLRGMATWGFDKMASSPPRTRRIAGPELVTVAVVSGSAGTRYHRTRSWARRRERIVPRVPRGHVGR